MPTTSDIRWFKQQFGGPIEAALDGTPFDLDMLVAIACQETGHVWSVLRRKSLSDEKILALCVGDTLDEDKGRRAFPKNKDELIAEPDGQKMFDIAHQALVDMAQHIPGFQAVATRPHKFCHGFGLFQLDLQFFKVDTKYFLEKRYEKLDHTLAKCLEELTSALRKRGLEDRQSLSDFEFATVAIVYNTGGFNPDKGLKQGHFSGGRFYGEQVLHFTQLSRRSTGEAGDEEEEPLLVPGAKDPDGPVRRLQRLLIRAGHELTIDGDFGDATERAVRAFQRDGGLEVDGLVGADTWSALKASV